MTIILEVRQGFLGHPRNQYLLSALHLQIPYHHVRLVGKMRLQIGHRPRSLIHPHRFLLVLHPQQYLSGVQLEAYL